MSEEKKTAVTEEVKEEVRKLTEEELAQVSGGWGDSSIHIHIDQFICTGCEDCYNTCPVSAIDMSTGKAQLTNNCMQCYACVDVCPTGAITVS